jgi:predicted nucleic acid-binding Zn ribbon protein
MSRTQFPHTIAKVLENTFKNLHIDQSIKKYSIWNHWEEIVGKNVAAKAQPVRIQSHTLVIAVTSHPWMTELTLMKSMILEKIRKKIENCPIQNIRFELAQGNKQLLPSLDGRGLRGG